MATDPPLDAARVVADLRELERRTGGPEGARRICWGPVWHEAREFLTELLAELGLEPETDEAGNMWAYLDGEREGEPTLALGSHLDSVPHGGWLDGAYGVMAAVGVLRSWVDAGRRPPRTLALVDWSDEEGTRFGRSLLGSSAFSGSLDPAELAALSDADGRRAEEVIAGNGIELATMTAAGRRRERLGAYLELHIEQGPVLEREGLAAAAVSGCPGIERLRFTFSGQASHAGTTPMNLRRDAGLAAAEAALAIERLPTLSDVAGGVATTGELELEPNVITAVAGSARLSCDLRHPQAEPLAAMLSGARKAAAAAAAGRDCELAEQPVWRIEPLAFDPRLVELATQAVEAVTGTPEGARQRRPARRRRGLAGAARGDDLLLLARGISHAPEEDSPEDRSFRRRPEPRRGRRTGSRKTCQLVGTLRGTHTFLTGSERPSSNSATLAAPNSSVTMTREVEDPRGLSFRNSPGANRP